MKRVEGLVVGLIRLRDGAPLRRLRSLRLSSRIFRNGWRTMLSAGPKSAAREIGGNQLDFQAVSRTSKPAVRVVRGESYARNGKEFSLF